MEKKGPGRSSDSLIASEASKVRLLCLDVDGTLTSGQIVYSSSGSELKSFSTHDGHGLVQLRDVGIAVAIISGRQHAGVARRAEELGISYLFQNVKDKVSVARQLLQQLGLQWDQLAFVGDDLPDLPLLERSVLPCCPADAVAEVRSVCKVISTKRGGYGAVREVTDLIRVCCSLTVSV